MFPVLLQTKYQFPQPRPYLVHRPALFEKLAAGLAGKLTLVSAPAGFGKTTLITDYFSHGRKREPDARWCWLSLDGSDNDPTRFFTYVIAALQSAVPDFGQPAAALLSSPQLPSLEPIISLLSNELLSAAHPIILVLDDYHTITTPAIHQALALWLDHLPPNLHLILTSRADPPLPLPRLRVLGELIEIRAADLRFTAEQAADFLHQIAGLDLTPEEVAALEQRTEGWIAGLQLAALSIRGRSEVAGFIRAFTGSHVYILDYLAAEVLQQQQADVLRFLQDTAVLEQMNASLCTALTGRNDCESLLRQLYQSNLFLEALDDSHQWFRFHALFREVLLAQLHSQRRDDLPQLHLRASQWFAQAGQITAALDHAFAAGDTALAVELIEQHAEAYLNRSEYVTIRKWLEQLPPTVRRGSPRLVLVDGTILTVTGSTAEAEQLLQESASLFEAADLPSDILGELALLQTIIARFQGRYSEAAQYGRQALVLIPPDRLNSRNKVLVNLLMTYFLNGDVSTAEDLMADFREDDTETYLVLAFCLPLADYYRGKLGQSATGYQHVVEKAAQRKRLPFVPLGFSHQGLGDIAYERNKLPEAIDHLSQGVALLKNSIEQIIILRVAGKLALAHWAAGNKSAALNSLDDISGWREKMRLADMGFSIVLAYHRAALYLQMGDLDSAVRAIAPISMPELTIGRAEEYLIHCRLLLAQNRPKEALELLNQLAQETTKRGWNGMGVEINCQKALAWAALGDQKAALACLAESLPLAEQSDYRRVFLDKGQEIARLLTAARRQGHSPDYLDSLLADFASGPPQQTTASPLPDPLSVREMELLQWVATGASNKQIADQLFISIPTVKKHISHILVKLDVTNRTQAIARARELGLF